MVMEILRTIALATCENCGGAVVLLQGDLSQEFWSHDGDHLGQHCPGTPKAEPKEGTIVEMPRVEHQRHAPDEPCEVRHVDCPPASEHVCDVCEP